MCIRDSYLGELALVPHDSPISNMNILFYNTLFDENASCHLALGKAYPVCIKDSEDMKMCIRDSPYNIISLWLARSRYEIKYKDIGKGPS